MQEYSLLSAEELEKVTLEIPLWHIAESGDAIERTWTVQNFDQAMNFIHATATLAKEQNHHPDIHWSYKTVSINLSTHNLGGISGKDVRLAKAIDRLPEGYGETVKAEDFLAG